MKTLQLMQRLQSWLLEEKRRELSSIEGKLLDIESNKLNLANQMLSEQKFVKDNDSLLFIYGSYAKEAVNKREVLNDQLEQIQPILDEARSNVQTNYQEVRRYELIIEKLKKEDDLRQINLEQKNIDEMSIEMHRSKSNI